jgi:hypothetical protein
MCTEGNRRKGGREIRGTNVERRAAPSDGGQQGQQCVHPVRKNDKRLSFCGSVRLRRVSGALWWRLAVGCGQKRRESAF